MKVKCSIFQLLLNKASIILNKIRYYQTQTKMIYNFKLSIKEVKVVIFRQTQIYIFECFLSCFYAAGVAKSRKIKAENSGISSDVWIASTLVPFLNYSIFLALKRNFAISNHSRLHEHLFFKCEYFVIL